MHLNDYVNDRADAAKAQGVAIGIGIGKEKGLKKGLEKGIRGAYALLLSAGMAEENAVSMISRQYGKTPEEIREILRRTEQTV